jgi:thiamine kinase-like enzyme
MHHARIYHGDCHLKNFMFKDGNINVIDFGLSEYQYDGDYNDDYIQLHTDLNVLSSDYDTEGLLFDSIERIKTLLPKSKKREFILDDFKDYIKNTRTFVKDINDAQEQQVKSQRNDFYRRLSQYKKYKELNPQQKYQKLDNVINMIGDTFQLHDFSMKTPKRKLKRNVKKSIKGNPKKSVRR